MNNDKVHLSYKKKLFCCFSIIPMLTIVLLSIILYINIQKVLINETYSNNLNTLGQLKSASELILKEVDRSITGFAFDKNLEMLPSYYDNLNYRERDNLYQKYATLLSSNINVTSFSIYFPDSKKIYVCNIPLMFSIEKYPERNYIEHIYKTYAHTTTSHATSPFNIILGTYNQETYLTFVKPCHILSNAPKALMIVSLNPNFLNDTFQNIKMDFNASIFIADDKGTILTSTNTIFNENISSKTNFFKDLDPNTPSFLVSIENKDYLACYTKSELLNLNYFYLLPFEQVTAKTNFVRNIILVIAILASFFLILFALLATKINYKPILHIMNLLKADDKNNTLQPENDIGFINKNLAHLLAYNKDLELSLDQNKPYLKSALLNNLIRNQIFSTESIWDKIDFYNMRISKNKLYCICVIMIDQYTSVYYKHNEKQLKLLEIYQYDTINQFLSDCEMLSYEVFGSNSNELCLLLSVSPGEENSLKPIFTGLQGALSENMTFTLSLGIGNLYDTIDTIYLSYQEAQLALKHTIIKGINSIVFYDAINTDHNPQYKYPFRIQSEIEFSLKQGNLEKLLENIHNFVDDVKNEITDINTIRYPFIQLLDFSVQLAAELMLDSNTLFPNQNLYQDLMKCETIQAVEIWFTNFYTVLIKCINQKKNTKEDDIFSKLKCILDQHYTDEDLSLDMLASTLGFSTSYLSKLFKEYEGKTIKDYITFKRLETAKSLLLTSSLLVKDVGLQIGYNNTRSFINIFKKYVGMTPGEYRDFYVTSE